MSALGVNPSPRMVTQPLCTMRSVERVIFGVAFAAEQPARLKHRTNTTNSQTEVLKFIYKMPINKRGARKKTIFPAPLFNLTNSSLRQPGIPEIGRASCRERVWNLG